MTATKYTQFARAERNITLLPTSQQFTPLVFTSDDDITIVGIIVDIALGLEAPTDAGSVSLAGYARIAIYRAGQAIPLIVPDSLWNVGATPATNTLLDGDAGDTWAIVPFAIASATGSLAAPGGGPSNIQLHMSPGTKRSLRRGDQCVVEINYSNGGNQNAGNQESVTGTLFTVD